MRFPSLTALFIALFALFSSELYLWSPGDALSDFLAAVAYASPIPPQGAISKRCSSTGDCRNAEVPSSVSANWRFGQSTIV
jgi:hypothetical protein